LKQLAEQLGTKLFDRVGRRLVLRPSARAAIETLRYMQRDLSSAIEILRSEHSLQQGTLKIGTLPTVGLHILAPIIARFSKKFPLIKIRQFSGLTGEQMKALRIGEIDFVSSVGPESFSSAQMRHVGRVRPVLAVPKGHALAALKDIGPDDLKKERLIAFPRVGDPFFDTVCDFWGRHGLDSNIVAEIPHIHTIQSLTQKGVGLGVIPDYTLDTKYLVGVPITGLDSEFPIWIAVREGALKIPLLNAFWEMF